MRSWKLTLASALLLLATGAAVAGGGPGGAGPASLLPAVPPTAALAERAAARPASPSLAHELTKSDVDTWLDGYLPYALRSADIPGAVVTVVADGKILTSRGFGYADLSKRTLVDPDRTLFRPGSVSKLFTWTAAMQLVEAGKLDLDRDVNTYLDFRIPPFEGKPITLRQLMTHTAGFEEVARGVVFYDPRYNVPLERYLKRYTPKRIFAPGSTPAYSNWATALAAYLVQRTSGEEFDTYLERHIFAPLGMRNTTFRQPLPTHLAGQVATGYPEPGTPKPFELVGPSPAGSASSTGNDMGRFMLAHLQRGELDGHRILRPETADLMHNSPLDRVDPMSLIPPLNRMELGFFESNINGREVVGHLGDTQAFHTSLHLFMKEGVGFFVSFNSSGKGGAVQALRVAIFEDFADRYFPDIAPPDGRVDARTAAAHAKMMTGNWMASRRAESSFLSAFYWLAGQEQVTTGANGELVVPSLKNAGGRPREWVEIAPFLWRNKYGHDRLAAKVVNGEVIRWTYDLAAPFEMYDRVPASRSATWLLPALYASLAVLLLTFVLWPATWLVRRSYKVPMPLAGRSLQAYRASRLMAGLTFGLLVAWAITVVSGLSDNDAMAGGLDSTFWALQIAGVVIFFGAVLISGWNVWSTWTDGRKWTRKLWSVLLLLASLLVLYVAVVFNLVALTVNY